MIVPRRPASVRASANAQQTKPAAVGPMPRYTVQATADPLPAGACRTSSGAYGRHAIAPTVQASHVTASGEAWRSAGFWATMPAG